MMFQEVVVFSSSGYLLCW